MKYLDHQQYHDLITTLNKHMTADPHYHDDALVKAVNASRAPDAQVKTLRWSHLVTSEHEPGIPTVVFDASTPGCVRATCQGVEIDLAPPYIPDYLNLVLRQIQQRLDIAALEQRAADLAARARLFIQQVPGDPGYDEAHRALAELVRKVLNPKE